MFRAVFERFFRGARPRKVDPAVKVGVPVARAPAASPSVPRTPRPPGPPPVGVGARRPLVGPNGDLAGFEFHAGAAGRGRLRRLEDEVTIRAVVANVLGAMRLCLGQGLAPVAEVPATWLARTPEDLFAPGMRLVLAIDEAFTEAATLARLVERLRRAGCRVGWRAGAVDEAAVSGSKPDFLLVAAAPGADREAWRAAVLAVAKRHPGVDQVLLDLPDIETLEALSGAPVVLAACALGPAPARGASIALSPQTAHLLLLLTRIARDDDNALLVADIKSDAALALRLLQFLNSAGASPGRPLDSIDQAVMVLGRDTLYRWAAQMIVRMAPARQSVAALQAMALARARFFELLARSVDEPQPGQLYLFGLVSMLPRLLGCSMADAVGSLDLPPAASEALLEDAGPWRTYLALGQAIDAHDLAAAAALAEAFQGLPAVLALSARAWLPVG